MSGHSQFKNIMYRKGAQDAKKAKVFAKLARDITIAAKSGLPEPDKTPRLRLAIQAARAESMPKDNIERAIAKASQSAGGDASGHEPFKYVAVGCGGVNTLAWHCDAEARRYHVYRVGVNAVGGEEYRSHRAF